MSQKTKLELAAEATVIRNETAPGANTCVRNGDFFLNMKDSLLGSYFTDKAGLEVIRAASQLDFRTEYRITDGTTVNPRTLALYAMATNGNLFYAIDLINGASGTYLLSTDVFIPQGYILTAPTVTTDLANGFYVGQILKTIDTKLTYICTDSTTGAAVWAIDPTVEVAWSKSLTAVNIKVAGAFDIAELPAVSGYYWNIESCIFAYTHGGIDFDGGSKVAIIVDGATAPQYTDATEILISSGSITGRLTTTEQIIGSVTESVVANAKVQVYLNSPSTVGNGTLKIQGTARLIAV